MSNSGSDKSGSLAEIATVAAFSGLAPLSTQGGESGPETSLELFEDVIDRLWMAILVVGADGRILVSNTAADRILGSRDGLMRIGDAVTTNRPAETRALMREIAGVVGNSLPVSPGRALGAARATRPSGLSPYVLLIAPFAAFVATRGGSPSALVVIGDLELPVPDCGRHLSLAFDLTDAEVQVAMRLLHGDAPAAIARQRGVQLSTIRSQIKAIFAKTGTRRQLELIKLLSRLPNIQ